MRYDGVYRILRCWRTRGSEAMLVCRYLFVRCDNEPAPWSMDEAGDGVRLAVPPEAAAEIAAAVESGEEVYEMGENPFWDFDPATEAWGWAKPPPAPAPFPFAHELRVLKNEFPQFDAGLLADFLMDEGGELADVLPHLRVRTASHRTRPLWRPPWPWPWPGPWPWP